MKSIFASKTFWFNLIVGLGSVLVYVNPENLTSFGIPPATQAKLLAIAGALTGIINFVLRMYTKTAVSLNPSAPVASGASDVK